MSSWFRDADGDGYGDAASTVAACDAPTGYVSVGTDCDDARGGSHPGAGEIAYDGLDQDCDGADVTDSDGDGFVAFEAGGDDCDDLSAGAFPGGVEVDGDGLDNDCDGQADPRAETWAVGSVSADLVTIAVTGTVAISEAALEGVVEVDGGTGGKASIEADGTFRLQMNASSTGIVRALDADGNTVGLRIVAKAGDLASPTGLTFDTEETLWALLLLSPGWSSTDPYVAAVLREYARSVADPTELSAAVASLEAHLAADPTALFAYPEDVARFLAGVQRAMIDGAPASASRTGHAEAGGTGSTGSSLNTVRDGDGADSDLVDVSVEALDSAEASGRFTFTNQGFRWVAVYADADDSSTSVLASGDSRWVALLPARSYEIPGPTDLAARAVTAVSESIWSALTGATGEQTGIEARLAELQDDLTAAPEDYTATFAAGELEPFRAGRFQVTGGGGGADGSDPGERHSLPMALDLVTTIAIPIVEIAVDLDLDGPSGSVDTTACQALAVTAAADFSDEAATVFSAVLDEDWRTFFDAVGGVLYDVLLNADFWGCMGVGGIVTPDWVAEQVLDTLDSAALGWADLATSIGSGALNGFGWLTTIDETPRGASYDIRLADRDEDGAEDEVLGGTDCDDEDAGTYPGAEEACDGADNDCDGAVDDSAGQTWYADADGDGWGNDTVTSRGCTAPEGYVADAGDCDDTTTALSPDATELVDRLDNDCDGVTDEGTDAADDDGDSYSEDGGDCDDSDASVHPGATETRDGVDEDCDGRVDDLGVWTYEDVSTSGDVGTFASLALDGTDSPHFAGSTSADTLGYFYEGTYGWSSATVDSSSTLNLQAAEIAVDPSGYAHFLWYDAYADDVRYAWYAASGRTTRTVDADIVGSYAYTEGLLALAIDAAGESHIVFSDSDAEAIRYGVGASGVFTLQTVSTADPLALDLALDPVGGGGGRERRHKNQKKKKVPSPRLRRQGSPP
ncbi:MAG: putative metal-binding motif-containing protein, partial [Myxococcota bacterium]